MFDYKEIERTIKDNHLPFQEIGDVTILFSATTILSAVFQPIK